MSTRCYSVFLGVFTLGWAGSAAAATWTIFSNQVPAATAGDRDLPYELGTKFKTTVGARVLKVRVYASAEERGEHTVRLWRVADSALIAGPYAWTFPSGTTGWKEFTLPTPVVIEGNTDYIIDVTNGTDQWYFCTEHAFDAPINNGPLVTFVGSGVYTTTLGAMPTQIWNNSNYYRDVVIETFAIASGPSPANGALAVTAPLFQWAPGDGARFHDVYVGTTPDLGPAHLVQPRSPLTMYWYPQPLTPGATYYWRVDEIEADGVTIHPGDVWNFTTQALTAYHPDPADGTTDVSPAPTLVWLPGQAVMQHHLYFSDNLEAVQQGSAAADKGELNDPSFAPGELGTLATYYWRVDEVVAGGSPRAGVVWSFTTCLPVEDFESYNDDDGKGTRIYETWVDGYLDGSSGSTVGNTEAPFAEQTIVHGGAQSMPLDYNNVDSPFYSEAVREFTPAQDWAANDVNELVLYVRGLAMNTAAPLYVAIEDASRNVGVAVHPDPAVVTSMKWIAWKIPFHVFTDAGVNMARVKKMYIGIGDKANPTKGGTGRIFVDDIRLARSAGQ
jgi:hypothetical protein